MRHRHSCRPVLASLLSGAVALVPLTVLALSGLFAQPVILSTGEGDDAAMRGSGLILLSLPFVYMVAVTLALGLGYCLLRFGRASLRAFLIAALLVAVAALVAAMAAATSKGSALDSLLVFAFTFALAAASTLPAASCWWLLATRGNNA